MNNVPHTNSDALLRQHLSDAVGPVPLSDTELAAALDRAECEALSDDQVDRILSSTRRLLGTEHSAANTTGDPAASVPDQSRPAAAPQRIPTEAPVMKRSSSVTDPHRPSRGSVAAVIVATITLCCVLVVTGRRSGTSTSLSDEPSRTALYAGSTRDEEPPPWLTPRPHTQAAPPRVAVGDVLTTSNRERRRVALPDQSILYLNGDSSVAVTDERQIRLQHGDIFVEVAQQADAGGTLRTFRVVTPDRTVTALGTRFAVTARDDQQRVTVTQGRIRVSGVAESVTAGQQVVFHPGTAATAPGNAKDAILTVAPRASTELDWTRELRQAAEEALIPASEFAGGALTAVDPDGQETRLSLRRYHVDVHLEDGFARTTIDQTYFNHASSRLEGTFHFPLPPDASLSRLAMYVNGRLMEGGMAERNHARNTFEQIVHKMQDPALLEWVDGSLFRMRVFPLEPRQEKRIVLSYTQRLPQAYGTVSYRFPAGHSMDVVGNWSTHIRIKGGAGCDWDSPSHDLQAQTDDGDLILTDEQHQVAPNDDLVLQVHTNSNDETSPQAADDEFADFRTVTHGEHDYLMVRLRPEIPGQLTRRPHHWIFLFEASGDRTPLLARTQIELVRTLLENAEHTDTFELITATTRPRRLSPEPTVCSPENVRAAIRTLERTHLIGALDLEAAVRECVGTPNEASGEPVSGNSAVSDSNERTTLLVHLGAGQPALGSRDPQTFRSLLPADLTYVGVGVGRQWNRSLMKELAESTQGAFTQVNPDENVAWRGFELYSTLHAPRLTHVAVKAADSGESDTADSPQFLLFSDLCAQGEEIAAVCRVPHGQPLPDAVTVSARLSGDFWCRDLAVETSAADASYLPRFWARLEIERLLMEDAAAHREHIVALSKAMYVMSPFTSLLVLENEEMYTQYNVDRGRRDHWALYPCPDEIDVVREPHAMAPTSTPDVTSDAPVDLRQTIRRLPRARWVTQPSILVVPVQYGDEFQYRLGDTALLGIDANRAAGLRGITGSARHWTWEELPLHVWSLQDSDGASSIHNLDFRQFASPAPVDLYDKFQPPQFDFDAVPPPLTQLDGAPLGLTIYSGDLHGRTWADAGRPIRLLGSHVDFSDPVTEFNNHVFFVDPGQASIPGRDGLSRPQILLSPIVPGLRARAALSDEHWQRPGIFLGEELVESQSQFGLGLSTGTDMPDVTLMLGSEPTHRLFDQSRFGETRFGTPRFDVGPVRLFALPHEPPVDTGFVPLDAYLGQPGVAPLSVLSSSRFANGRGVSAYPIIPQLTRRAERESFAPHRWAAAETPDPHRWFALPSPSDIVNLQFGQHRAAFGDLLSHAPGLNTSAADVSAILQGSPSSTATTDGAPGDSDDNEPPLRGTVDPRARKLIEAARDLDWEAVTVPGAEGEPGVTVICDGRGRHVWQRIVSEGLREHVVCDGATLWHIYREIGLASARDFSRFHHRDLARIIPWLVPSADDLACDGDVVAMDDHTVEIRPLGTTGSGKPQTVNEAPASADGESTMPRRIVRLVFRPDGSLAERQLRSLDGALLLKLTMSADGDVVLANEADERLLQYRLPRATVAEPNLEPPLAGLVCLPLPVRSADVIVRRVQGDGDELPEWKDWSETDALALMLADTAAGRGDRVIEVARRRFLDRDDRRGGLFVLLSRFPQQLVFDESPDEGSSDAETQNVDLRPDVEGSPLKQFLRQYINWARSRDDSVDFALDSAAPGLLTQLVAARNHTWRWRTGRATTDRTADQIADEFQRTLEFVAGCRTAEVGWTVLSAIPPRLEDPELRQLFIDAARQFEQHPLTSGVVRLARVRALLSNGSVDDARIALREWLRGMLARSVVPVLDADIRNEFAEQDAAADWQRVIREAAFELVNESRFVAALMLSRQLRQLGDTDVADQILDAVLADLPAADHPVDSLLVIEQLAQRSDARADTLFGEIQDLPLLQDVAPIWRLAAAAADAADRPREALDRLEKAITIEFRTRPEVINVDTVNADYSDLLTRLEQLADAARMLESEPPTGLATRVIRAADQWRSLVEDDTQACQQAARILGKLDLTDTAWEYLTTPLAGRAGEAEPWKSLATSLTDEQRIDLADMAWTRAFEMESTDPGILLAHARMLHSHRRNAKARQLTRQIVEGSWQPRFSNIVAQAEQLLQQL